MRECLLSTVALCWQLNQAISSGRMPEKPLDLSQLTKSSSIRFIQPKRRLFRDATDELVASTASEWLDFARLKYDQAVLINLRLDDDDRLECGRFGGGCIWNIAAIHGDEADIWQPIYQVTETGRHVTYRHTSTKDAIEVPAHEPQEATLKWLQALSEAHAFAHANHLPEERHFEEAAEQILGCEEPFIQSNRFANLPGYDGLPLKSRQLLSGADKAWVFGAKNSWSRNVHSDSKWAAQARLSDRLYEASCSIIAVAATAVGE